MQVERLKLPKKLVSFMESREEILVRQMPITKKKAKREKEMSTNNREKEMPTNEREEVSRWGFKVGLAQNTFKYIFTKYSNLDSMKFCLTRWTK